MILPSFQTVGYTCFLWGNQTGANLQTRMTAVPIDLSLPQRWGLIPFGDQTVINPSVPPSPATVQRQIQFAIMDNPLVAVAKLLAGDSAGPIASISVTSSGPYSAPPIITFTGGGGKNAAAIPNMGLFTQGVINSVATGSGYNPATTTGAIVGGNVAPASQGGKVASGVTVNVVAGGVQSVTIANSGSGYTTYPQIVITDSSGAGSGAEVFGWLQINSIKLTNGGTGFLTAPTVGSLALFRKMTNDNIIGVQNKVLQAYMKYTFGNALNSPILDAVDFSS